MPFLNIFTTKERQTRGISYSQEHSGEKQKCALLSGFFITLLFRKLQSVIGRAS